MMVLDAALAALSDPSRRRIVEILSAGPRSAGEVAQDFDISRPAVSKHLKVLRQAQLVDVVPQGRCRVYRLAPRGLDEVRRWMAEADQMWDRALASFKRFAESGQR